MLKNAQVSIEGDRVEIVHSIEQNGAEITLMFAMTAADALAYVATIQQTVKSMAPKRDRITFPAHDHDDGGAIQCVKASGETFENAIGAHVQFESRAQAVEPGWPTSPEDRDHLRAIEVIKAKDDL
jgi:hypothetical protein